MSDGTSLLSTQQMGTFDENGNYVPRIITEDDLVGTDLTALVGDSVLEFEDGDLVVGTVVKIDHDEVLLDIGFKSEGVIPSRELSIRNDVDPSEIVSMGERVECLVLQKEDKEGRLVLSKKRAQYEKAWANIEELKNRDEVVKGVVIEVVKGGLIVDIGLRGFLPASLVELRRVRELQPLSLIHIYAAIEELVELNHSSRDDDRTDNERFYDEHRAGVASSVGGAALLSAAGGLALVGVLASSAAAMSTQDVQILQTAASIENLAVSTYKTALTLPYIGGASANGVVRKFAQVTMSQHAQHAEAFNAAVRQLGGTAQTKPDPAFVPVVDKAVKSLSGVSAAAGTLGVVGLALELENIAAETYVKDTVLALSLIHI